MKALRDLRYRLFYGLLLKRRVDLLTLGAPESICKWTICPAGLNAQSVVYSGGVGSDITFEQALAKRFGCQIVLLDPSPAGIKTMSLGENKIPQFRFHPIALAGHNGTLSLAPPPDPDGDSWFAAPKSEAKLEVQATDLGTLMQQNKHQRIDLLKLDIEGCEYEVIDDILAKQFPVHQICVEFHHGILPGINRGQTIRAMLKLIRHGYDLVDQTGANHTFIQRQ